MSTIEKLRRVRSYNTVRVESDPAGACHWLHMHTDVGRGIRPCFRTELMNDMWDFLSSITLRDDQRSGNRLRHVVLASDAPAAFNLGGDLELFARLIREQDRQRLLSYARHCIDGVHHLHTGLGGDVRTIALIQGDALGGGMELALACHHIVAEEGVEMGLPEVLFGLFPGMGAYSFLSRRVSSQMAERIILEGRLYKAEELHRMGVVDILAPKGGGAQAVEALIQQQQRSPISHLALNAARTMAQPVSRDELMNITELWVDSALRLGDKSLKMMERIVRAQVRRSAAQAA
ncbi:crotonase/enoyl-CoA hydratase family protein [Agrilutibacter solisilvae]|uniref:Crotonase/enoyl-CoA hydratase family protein n=1 Tax=Agrilutibacter solisilvae TaxID=2763317 RepID=A0A974Y3K9_9GAMM|nr:crotonase/enoyl-CoA hydratase family protein [Lysobacter solisilvae]QSX80058.1 crotonase/enoyl-CoA hydratase family protein [Lysobacter solisilvae]